MWILNISLPKAQVTHGMESFNFIELSKPINKSRSNFNLVLFGKGRETLTIACYNYDNSFANSKLSSIT